MNEHTLFTLIYTYTHIYMHIYINTVIHKHIDMVIVSDIRKYTDLDTRTYINSTNTHRYTPIHTNIHSNMYNNTFTNTRHTF